MRFETDVVGAALGEQARGAGQGCRDLVYVTIGTGIGAGLVVDGAPVRGRLHPEVGTCASRAQRDTFRGICPPAPAGRDWRAGRPPRAPDASEELPTTTRSGTRGARSSPGALALTLRPHPSVPGRRRGRAPSGPPRAGAPRLLELAAGYLPPERFGDDAAWLQPAGLGSGAGIEGAFVLARSLIT